FIYSVSCIQHDWLPPMKPLRLLCCTFAFVLTAALNAAAAIAHDIPNAVSLHAFVKPEGERLHLLIRLPTTLLRTLDLPTRGPRYISFGQGGKHLELAAGLVAKEIEIRADGERLSPSRSDHRISLPTDNAFDSYARAVELIDGPALAPDTDVYWQQGYFD